MDAQQKSPPAGKMIMLFLIIASIVVIKHGYVDNEKWYWLLFITLPPLIWAILNESVNKILRKNKIKNHETRK